jgi:YD repeat-containing protein
LLTDAANPFSVVTYRYDPAGKVILADDPIGQGKTTYEWNGDTLVRSTQIQIGGEQSVSVYEFGTGYVLDSVVNSPLSTQVRYSLSANGYPLLQTYSSVTGVTLQYLFEYDGCRLKSMNRVRSTTSGEPNATFEYDSEGHLSRVNVVGGTVVDYDYSCWN